MSNDPTVFLVDDDDGLRGALRWLLESAHHRVETFVSGEDFLESYDPDRPGCLVLDVRMPGMSGLELQRELVRRESMLPIIVITGHGDVPMCVRAFEGGAFAFLEKPVDHQLLLEHVPRGIQHNRELRSAAALRPRLAENIARLTPREREVMDLIAVGKSMKRIASQLGISIQTCSKHHVRVLDKMGVDNDVELVRLLLESQKP